ncbi:hypothetical protein DN436_02565 [Lactobacillus reuteri]|nr:hypothetical protein [Limosilactobacillus reuteri]
MRTTRRWGFVNSTAQEYMLNHAERTRKRLVKKKPTGQRLSAFKVHKNKYFFPLIHFTIRY